MNFQEFLSNEEIAFSRCESAEAKIPRSRASYPHDGTLVSCVIVCLADAISSQATLDLKRYLSIPRRLIFESSVRAGTPSLAAAPREPATRP